MLMLSAYFSTHAGGIEAVADRLTRELLALGHEVSWLAAAASAAPTLEAGGRAVSLPSNNLIERVAGVPVPIPGPTAVATLRREICNAEVLIIHDALYLTHVIAFLLAQAAGKPVIMVQHVGATPYASRLLRGIVRVAEWLVSRPVLASAAQVVFISQATARHFDGLTFRRPPSLIFNGVDQTVFGPGGDHLVLRKRFGLPSDQPVALFAGRFVEKKGLAILERAARARPDIIWAFAGVGPIDPTSWALPNVTVLGRRPPGEMADLYRCADVLALPSVGEGYPLVVQEAMACGLPVVCGLDSAAADPQAAKFLRGVAIDLQNLPRSTAAFLAGLDELLRSPPESQEISRFAARRYNWRAAAHAYQALTQSLTWLGGRGG